MKCYLSWQTPRDTSESEVQIEKQLPNSKSNLQILTFYSTRSRISAIRLRWLETVSISIEGAKFQVYQVWTTYYTGYTITYYQYYWSNSISRRMRMLSGC